MRCELELEAQAGSQLLAKAEALVHEALQAAAVISFFFSMTPAGSNAA